LTAAARPQKRGSTELAMPCAENDAGWRNIFDITCRNMHGMIEIYKSFDVYRIFILQALSL
jgi:hypothetical protein